MEKFRKGEKKIFWIKLILIILFIHNAYVFAYTEGSNRPLLGPLFNMIIILAILIFIYHKKDIIEGNKEFIGQRYIDNYLKKRKIKDNYKYILIVLIII